MLFQYFPIFYGATQATITAEGDINLSIYGVGIAPSIPDSGLTLFNRRKGGRNLLSIIGPAGVSTALQPFFGSNRMSMWSHNGNTNLITAPSLFLMNFEHAANTNTEGAVTARNIGTSSYLGATRRLSYVTTAATNLSVAIKQVVARHWIGSTSYPGGFHAVWRFGYNTASYGNRGFLGFSSATASIWGRANNPSGTTSSNICIGMGFDAADSTWSTWVRGTASSVVTKIDTFIPKPTDLSMYEASIFCASGQVDEIHFSLEDISSYNSTWSYYGTQSTLNGPRPGTALSHRIWGNTGTASTVLALDVISMYIETDF